MAWQEPNNYTPRDDLESYLLGLSPKINTAELDMVVYWQWVHETLPAFRKSPTKAWNDLHMTPPHARDAIDERIVPMEIYDLALKRAQE